MTNMFACHWLWLYAGALLMLLELMAPGFVIFFFGLAAATVGILRYILGDDFVLWMQLASFSFLSIFFIVFLRRYMKKLFLGRVEETVANFDSGLVGRVAIVKVAIEPPLEGRVEIGDAEWMAIATKPFAIGDKVKVIAQENLTVKVDAI